jgi:hypothetical protein
MLLAGPVRPVHLCVHGGCTPVPAEARDVATTHHKHALARVRPHAHTHTTCSRRHTAPAFLKPGTHLSNSTAPPHRQQANVREKCSSAAPPSGSLCASRFPLCKLPARLCLRTRAVLSDSKRLKCMHALWHQPHMSGLHSRDDSRASANAVQAVLGTSTHAAHLNPQQGHSG